jgi:serine/threonine protein phosphatase PrpC
MAAKRCWLGACSLQLAAKDQIVATEHDPRSLMCSLSHCPIPTLSPLNTPFHCPIPALSPPSQQTIPWPPSCPPLQLAAKDQIITAEPDVLSQQLTAEDAFLVLACDGIWDVMTK